MKFIRLSLNGAGAFKDYTLNLADGYNVIVGGNGSGKSTLVEAVISALFDNPGARRAGERGSVPKKREVASLICLEYQSDGKTYRLTKDFATGSSLLEDLGSGSRWNLYSEIQPRVAQALGLAESEFYLTSALVKQGELGKVAGASELIHAKLEGMLNNNKDELLASRLLERLKERQVALTGQDSESSGPIAQLEKKLTSWRDDLALQEEKGAELVSARGKLQAAQNELQVVQKLFDDKHDLFKKSKLALEAEQNLNKEREGYLDLGRRVKEAQEIKNRITTKKETLKSMSRVERSELKSAESLSIQNQLFQGRVKDAIARLEKEIEAVKLSEPKLWYRYFAFIPLLAATVCGALWLLRGHDPLYLGSAGAGLILSAIVLGLWVSAQKHLKDAREKQKEAQNRLNDEEENLKRSDETLKAILDRFHTKDVDELAERYEEFRDLDRDIKTMVGHYESLLGENNLKDLETELEKITTRMNQQQEIFNKHRAYAIPSARLEQLQREVTDLDRKQNLLIEEATSFELKLRFIESGSDLIAPLQERLEEGEKQLHRLRTETELLALITKYLDEARRKTLKSSIEILEEEMSLLLNALSGGDWRQVRLDRHTMACQVSADNKTWHSVSDGLSWGIRDTVYLALRLALTRVICGDTKPPVILDDSLIQLDEERRRCAVATLRQLSGSYQVLLFTTDRRHAENADNASFLAAADRTESHSTHAVTV